LESSHLRRYQNEENKQVTGTDVSMEKDYLLSMSCNHRAEVHDYGASPS